MIKKQSGFSLAELVVVMGIAGFLSVIILQISRTAGDAAKGFSIREELRGMAVSISNTLAKDECTDILNATAKVYPSRRTPDFSYGTLGVNIAVKFTSTTPFIAGLSSITRIGDFFVGGKYIGDKFELEEFSLASNGVTDASTDGLLEIRAKFIYTKTQGVLGLVGLNSRKEFYRTIPVYVKLDGSGNIEGCTGSYSIDDNIFCTVLLNGEYDGVNCRNPKFFGNLHAENNLVAGQAP